jgi:SRSO17 transposase
MSNYIKGLLLPIKRKSIESMASYLAPDHVGRMHQSLHHIVAEAPWNDDAVLAAARGKTLPAITRWHRLAAWIIKDLDFPKKGEHSVGVARQRCGSVDKPKNRRVAVGVSVATSVTSLPVACRLYLPEIWVDDPVHRQTAGVPEKIVFQTKSEIAIEQLQLMIEADVQRAPVVADATYGNDKRFREKLEAMGLDYCVGIQPSTLVWLPGSALTSPKVRGRAGRPLKQLQQGGWRSPFPVKELVSCLVGADLHRVGWREGINGMTYSRFARLHVRVAPHWDCKRSRPYWLLMEWLTAEKEPTNFWLSNLPESTNLQQLVTAAKMCRVAERGYEELKKEVGLNDYEGRNWRGFHHHVTLCIAAYDFLVLMRNLSLSYMEKVTV